MPLPIHPGRPAGPPPDESAAGPGFGPQRTPYDALGGDEAVRRLVDTFYDAMDRDERFAPIRALHKPDLTEARGKLYEFLSGWLGGPQLYIEKYGHPRLRARHTPFPIGPRQRELWLACMAGALDACAVKGELRDSLDARFAHVAKFMENTP